MTRKKAEQPPEQATGPAPDVTLYPIPGAWIPDVEPVEQTVSAERADELLAYSPAAFTTDAPVEASVEVGPDLATNDLPDQDVADAEGATQDGL